MHRIWIAATAIIALGISAVAAEERGNDRARTPAVPPGSGTSSSDLSRSGGVITPPTEVDPGIKQTPPGSGATMPIIPPPGTPGGNSSVTPK